ncbi:MAG: SPOR domain-containing protein, partial [Lysobacter sp.]
SLPTAAQPLKPEATKPEVAKAEAAKTEVAKPEAPKAEAAKPVPPPATAAAIPPPATPLPAPEPVAQAKAQCFSIGPFADAAAADAARAKLQTLAQKIATRTEGGSKSARGWRVYLPTANADAAQATAQRIRAAGFNDLFVMSGAEANAIALGRFRSEESARKRGAELSAAGFSVRVEALGESSGGVSWIDVATTTSNGDALRRAAGAARWRGRACAG